MNDELKAAVTVAEMARIIGMSRSRLYQLIGKAFPEPNRDESGRPYFDEDQQRTIIEVRRRNCGIDGKPILFYAPRNSISAPQPKRRSKPKAASSNQHDDIIEGVRALGLTAATAAQVEQSLTESFPNGTVGVDPGEVIRSVFLSIKRQDTANKPSE